MLQKGTKKTYGHWPHKRVGVPELIYQSKNLIDMTRGVRSRGKNLARSTTYFYIPTVFRKKKLKKKKSTSK